jgi:hypothetical protein
LLNETGCPKAILFSSWQRGGRTASKRLKNRVTTAEETALLGARPEIFWPEGMFEIAHAVQKMTGNRYD